MLLFTLNVLGYPGANRRRVSVKGDVEPKEILSSAGQAYNRDW